MSEITRKTMPYVRLGKSGLKISKIVLGCMSYGSSSWQGWVLDEQTSLEHIKYAYDHGINAFDTANVYSDGLSEEILGKAIKQFNMNRDEIVVMTKVFFTVSRNPKDVVHLKSPTEQDQLGYVNQHGLSRKHIFESVDHSLKRLGLEYIDLLQCHRFDYETPIEETMQALHDVVKSGKVRYIGMSSCYAWQFHVMQNYAINNNLTPFISMQNHLNLAYREDERELMPTLEHFGVGCIPWSPLASGILARPLTETTKRKETDLFQGYYSAPATESIINRVEEVAKRLGLTMAQVALAWVMAKSDAPIVGTTSTKNLDGLLDAVNVKLSEEDIKALEEPYQPRSIFGAL
ncbi:aryl-alcohol dehydrogenase [Peniophora sp. CONT]|nr:aryl-alcohol dehydrogenase [Peniophora sp. CONT]